MHNTSARFFGWLIPMTMGTADKFRSTPWKSVSSTSTFLRPLAARLAEKLHPRLLFDRALSLDHDQKHLVCGDASDGASREGENSLLLSSMDLTMPLQYIFLIYVYGPPNSTKEFMSSRTLRDALARVLGTFWPAAGKLRDHGDGRMSVDRSDSERGVELSEVEFQATFDEKIGCHRQPQEFKSLVPNELPGIGSFRAADLDSPLLKAQLSRFGCGTVSLGVAIMHRLFDGKAATDFVRDWADIASGKKVSFSLLIDRSAIKARDPPQASLPSPRVYSTFPPPLPSNISHPMTARMFEFSAAQIRIIKEEANEGQGGPRYSAFDALAGHTWRFITAAREIESQKEVKLAFAVDGRFRYVPPLPSNYSGNVVFLAMAKTSAGSLLGNSPSFATSLVHEVKARVDDEYMKSTVDWVESQRHQRIYGNLHFLCGPDLMISSWSRFAVHDADFGWGGPTFFGGLMGETDGLVVFLPGPPGSGAWNVLVHLLEKHMLNLLRSDFFVPQ